MCAADAAAAAGVTCAAAAAAAAPQAEKLARFIPIRKDVAASQNATA